MEIFRGRKKLIKCGSLLQVSKLSLQEATQNLEESSETPAAAPRAASSHSTGYLQRTLWSKDLTLPGRDFCPDGLLSKQRLSNLQLLSREVANRLILTGKTDRQSSLQPVLTYSFVFLVVDYWLGCIRLDKESYHSWPSEAVDFEPVWTKVFWTSGMWTNASVDGSHETALTMGRQDLIFFIPFSSRSLLVFDLAIYDLLGVTKSCAAHFLVARAL